MIVNDPFVTPFVERQLSLSGAKAPEGRFPAYMRVDFRAGKSNDVQFTFGSGIYADDKQKIIKLNIPAFSFAVLAKQAEEVGSKDPGFEYRGLKINGIRPRKPGDDSKGIPTGWDGTVFIGKDSQGVCYICAMSKNVNKIKIPFAPDPKFVSMVDVRTNEPASLADVSLDFSAGWARTVMPIVSQLLVNHPYDFRTKDGGGDNGKFAGKNGNGGWQDRPSGGQQGQQRQQQAPANDMAFLDMGNGNSFDDDVMM